MILSPEIVNSPWHFHTNLAGKQEKPLTFLKLACTLLLRLIVLHPLFLANMVVQNILKGGVFYDSDRYWTEVAGSLERNMPRPRFANISYAGVLCENEPLFRSGPEHVRQHLPGGTEKERVRVPGALTGVLFPPTSSYRSEYGVTNAIQFRR